MSGLNYQAACVFDLSYRQSEAELKTASLRDVAKVFTYNIDGIVHLFSLPGSLVWITTLWQSSVSDAARNLFGTDKPGLEVAQSRRDELDAEARRLMEAEIAHPMYQESAKQAELGAMMRHQVEGFVEHMGTEGMAGIAAMLSFAVIQSWTAFEVLAVDLWVEAINQRPEPLAWRASISALAGEDGQQDGAGKTVSVRTLQKYKADLRNVMGTVLREGRKFDFNSLYGIRDAYIAAFDDKSTKLAAAAALFKTQDYQEMAWHEAARNLLVHRGGIVDQKFLDRVKNDKNFAGLTPGTYVRFTGNTVAKYTATTVRFSKSLLTFVDDWLSSHPT